MPWYIKYLLEILNIVSVTIYKLKIINTLNKLRLMISPFTKNTHPLRQFDRDSLLRTTIECPLLKTTV